MFDWQKTGVLNTRFLIDSDIDPYGPPKVSQGAVSLPILGSSLFGSGSSQGDDKKSKKKVLNKIGWKSFRSSKFEKKLQLLFFI